MEIKKVTDESFAQYGQVLKGFEFKELIAAVAKTPCPKDEVIYVPSVKELEESEEGIALKRREFGGIPIQIGYCNGSNKKMNALEYHRCSEVNIALDDVIILVGRQQDIEPDVTYDTSKAKAFLVPAGTGIELFATTLHYAPIQAAGDGFRFIAVLPRETNTDLDFVPEKKGESALLLAKNKFVLAHADAHIEGAHIGLKGENITFD
jgi:ureidoglycolate hydrolase